ncbi:putative AraC family transcriptional regulator [Microbacterium sp. C448]|uniref:helix-turn-helix domain-containing protein n=1 Tax=Microbacterium sp. C448 TaxID=1177594 RepID=UPI0003DE4DAB|nr:AraC family transcriptional regulator [Microbacterium sp. C448]CDJ99391.1 putative AraC family transcriptional regulator [Microbacterium sp. C448]
MRRTRCASYVSASTYYPILARTRSTHSYVGPVAYDYAQVVVVRSGSAILLTEFGQRPVTVGDVIVLAANTVCRGEPEGRITTTTIYLDMDYVIDQLRWQYAACLRDSQEARTFAETMFTEPSQILHVGEDRAGMMRPWLDELAARSAEGRFPENFYRMQALLFNIFHVITPFIKTSPVRTSITERAMTWTSQPRIRRFAPLRDEARKIADLLHSNPEHRWTISELANEVHLSKSQVGRVFVEAYGKSPIAYLTMLRTERMAGLLRTTCAPIAVIAREVGWSDPDFAARQFRRRVGLTPTRYRMITRGRDDIPRDKRV